MQILQQKPIHKGMDQRLTDVDRIGTRASYIDAVIVFVIVVTVVVIGGYFDSFERWSEFVQSHEEMELDELTIGIFSFSILMIWYTWRRQQHAHVLRGIALANERYAAEANQTKSEFLSHMSHELRTPLNAVIGYSQMITGGVHGPIGNDKYLEYQNDILTSGYHLLHLVNDVLDISKIEAEEFELYDAEVNVDELLTYCIRMIKGRTETRSVSFQYTPPESTVNILADDRVAKQIILNLLTNAAKYNVENGKACLSVVMKDDRSLAIVVVDTGVGISANDIPKVLEPFGQARIDAHRTHEGTGLGLPLSKKLIELHGGTLELESEIGKGTVATVTFPQGRLI